MILLSTSSRPVLGLTQPPNQWIPGIKRPGHEADQSRPSSAEAKKHITKGDNWPVSNDKLTNIYLKQFLHFVKSINLDLLYNYIRKLQQKKTIC
jgi:hypothetical protein